MTTYRFRLGNKMTDRIVTVEAHTREQAFQLAQARTAGPVYLVSATKAVLPKDAISR